MFFWYDTSFLLLVPAMLLAVYAQNKVSSTYSRYAQRDTAAGVPGSRVARELLDNVGLSHVGVEMTEGRLTDHYDPKKKVVRLSRDNYARASLAAVSIAAHEVGHAAQHAGAYAPLAVRNGLVPVVNLTTTLAWPLFFIGLILYSPVLVDVGIWMFVGAVAFQVITLPVEFNASSRAVALLEQGGYLQPSEVGAARQMLGAAALTYVAAMAVAVSHLLRMLILRGRRR